MPLTYSPFANAPELDQIETTPVPPFKNITADEQKWSLIGGAALIGASLAGRGLIRFLGILAGGALIHRGTTGHCYLYEAMGVNQRGENDEGGVADNAGHKVVDSIVIQRPRAELYAYWRRLENLPNVMSHVKSVEVINDRMSHWVVTGPAGVSLEWDAEIINDRENEMIAWQSLAGSHVPNAGSVWFEDAPDGGTRLKVAMEVEAPAGELGVMVAKLFGEAPEQQLRDDLQRFKEQMEGVASPS